MDRRRSYVDIMERVLGHDMLSQPLRQRSRFLHEIKLAGAALGMSVASVEVQLLGSIDVDEES